MNKHNRTAKFWSLIAGLIMIVFLTGCPDGGGGGGIKPPVSVNPVHTEFSLQPAQIHTTGQSYPVSAQVSETRGDEIVINSMHTWRTLTAKAAGSTNPYATAYTDTDMSYRYYSGTPDQTSYTMFIPGIPGKLLDDTTSPAYNFGTLKGYGRRTIKCQVMIGNQGQTRPAGFNGLFIPYSDYSSWIKTGKVGVKYWVWLEGYDHKLNDNYNIYLPLEIYFAGALLPGENDTNPYDSNFNPIDDGNTNPYNPGIQ